MVSEYRHTNMKNYRQPWQSASNQNIWSTDFNQQQPATTSNIQEPLPVSLGIHIFL